MSNGIESVAKQPRSVVLNDDLESIVRELQDRSGHTFKRIVTAALLKYFFELCWHPEHFSPGTPLVPFESVWMDAADALERGVVTLETLPESLLDGAIKSAKFCRKLRAHVPAEVAECDRTIEAAEKLKERWRVAAEDFQGAVGALRDQVQSSFQRFGASWVDIPLPDKSEESES